jgi:endonuclease-8
MPEGDTIFRSARALDRALAGRTVTRFETVVATLARGDDQHHLTGRTVERVEARGKWLLIHFSGDLILLTHMLMNGSWHIYRPGEPWRRARRHMRLVIETDEWHAVGFTVPIAEFHTAASLVRRGGAVTIGPDLLDEDFNEQQAIAAILERPSEEIAVVLLNQHVLAGIGNVFKSEICFACGIHPFRRVSSLSRREVEKLVEVAQRYLKMNVTEDSAEAPTENANARRTTGSLDRSARLWVYGRLGEACRRCGASILMRRQGSEARTTFWCPECQPLNTPAGSQTSEPRAVEGWTRRPRPR